jgi:hypothetical protein
MHHLIAWHFSRFCLKGGLTILKIILIIVIIAVIYCLGAAIACLVASAREIELPDIEDIEIGE